MTRARATPTPIWTPDDACRACGRAGRRLSRLGYCPPCVDAGWDTPWLTCRVEGCANTRRRGRPGEQLWLCHEHRKAAA